MPNMSQGIACSVVLLVLTVVVEGEGVMITYL